MAIRKRPPGDKSRAVKLNLLSTGKVLDLLLKIEISLMHIYSKNIKITYFFRSNNEILFPTGLMTVFPSGENNKSPFL
jgi:hypothetical protein